MKYLPATVAAIVVGFAVWWTHEPKCLWALLIVGSIVASMKPDKSA